VAAPYFTWSRPFLCFCPSAPWLLMSVACVLAYAPAIDFGADKPLGHSILMLTLEYGPIYVLAGLSTMRGPADDGGFPRSTSAPLPSAPKSPFHNGTATPPRHATALHNETPACAKSLSSVRCNTAATGLTRDHFTQ
jgi:hypothetical protein